MELESNSEFRINSKPPGHWENALFLLIEIIILVILVYNLSIDLNVDHAS